MRLFRIILLSIGCSCHQTSEESKVNFGLDLVVAEYTSISVRIISSLLFQVVLRCLVMIIDYQSGD